jgi:hypothetical protein
VYDRGSQLSKYSIELGIDSDAMTRRLLEGDELHVRPFDPPFELGNVRERDYGMSVAPRIKMVDQIHDTVFESPYIEAMHNVDDER